MPSIENILKDKVEKLGPMPVKDFFNYVLYNKNNGYYVKKNIIGKKGDFITAPEISQLFGEMIAIWIVLNSYKIYKNKDINLCELGPGKGTLMIDILRTIKTLNIELYSKIENIFFLDDSLSFTDKLKNIFSKTIIENDIGKLPKGTNIIVANEFFDAIPVNQYVFRNNNWYEKLIYLNNKKEFEFGLSKKKMVPNLFFPNSPIQNQVFEFSEYIVNLLKAMCNSINKYGGIILIIDYAKQDNDLYGTLSVIKEHKYVKPFYKLGKSDVSFKPDFSLISKIAKDNNCNVHGPISQSYFLQNMGIKFRVENLIKVNPSLKRSLLLQLQQLIDANYMGEIFSVISISNIKEKKLIGFDE